jgi:glutaredoxin
MVLPDHECPYGRRAKELLDQHGFEVDEHILASREEVEAFMTAHGLETTPLILVDGEEIGGCQELESFLQSENAQS